MMRQRQVSPSLTALPAAYISRSSGAAYIGLNNVSIVVPSGNAAGITFQTVTLSPPLPSRTVVTAISGTISYPANPQHLSKINWHVVNTSGGAVSGNITITGNDERGFTISETLSIASVANGNSSDTISSKYFASIVTISLSGTLGNSGVTITGSEYQTRGHIKLTTSGVVDYSWDNNYTSGEVKVATFELLPSSILRIQDWRTVGPIPKAQRIGSEIVDWSGGTWEGPDNWLGSCVYASEELLDGSVIIGGNAAYCSIFDGQEFGAVFVPTGLTGSDPISAFLVLRDNVTFHEVIYIGTYTGKLIRWDRTTNIYVDVTTQLKGTWGSNQVSKLLLGSQQNFITAVGTAGKCTVLVDNGNGSVTGYDYSTEFGAGSNNINDATYHDGITYGAGGGSSGMMFRGYITNNYSFDLTPYLPGTAALKGSNSGFLLHVASAGDGRLLLLGMGSSLYVTEWNTRQTHGRGYVSFTVGAALTIPAGFTVGDGTRTFKTRYAATSSGAGSLLVEVDSVIPGIGGCAAISTVTTQVDTQTNVSAVTNPEPIGMGRLVATASGGGLNTGFLAAPYSLFSNQPLASAWDGTCWIIAMQGGDILGYNGQKMKLMTPMFEFKGRATGVKAFSKFTLIYGDEGRVFTIPK